MSENLYNKVWEAHAVRRLANGQTQLLIGTHLIHEVTSPQAFSMLRELGVPVRYPERTFATVDHIVPTDESEEPFSDKLADEMIKALRVNCEEFGITFFSAECQYWWYPSGQSASTCSGLAFISWKQNISAQDSSIKSSKPFLSAARMPFTFQDINFINQKL